MDGSGKDAGAGGGVGDDELTAISRALYARDFDIRQFLLLIGVGGVLAHLHIDWETRRRHLAYMRRTGCFEVARRYLDDRRGAIEVNSYLALRTMIDRLEQLACVDFDAPEAREAALVSVNTVLGAALDARRDPSVVSLGAWDARRQ